MLKMTPKGSVGSFVVGRSNIDLETNTNNNYSYSNSANLSTTAIGNGKMSQGMAEEGEEQANAQLSNREEFHLHNLLENVDQMGTEHDSSWRKYARLVLPHIGLVIFVCLYAMFGAWVFYSIESPHEDRLKMIGIQRVYQMRQSLINVLISRRRKSWESDQTEGWKDGMEQQLNTFSEMLFKSYKENYVRYENVRFTNVHALQQLNAPHQSQMDSRFRRHFSKSRSDGKLWTPSSSLFFAATTMATIGYGNIVPVTSHGRIACIIFALFGAPLTIITIGDLGKFLSECTIWLYRRLKNKFYYFRYTFTVFWLTRRRKRRRRQSKKSLVFSKNGDFGGREFGGDEADEGEGEEGEGEGEGEDEAERRARAQLQRLKLKSIKSVDEWDEQENTEVPVLLVFVILLLYIAAGGLLFAIMESWTYMDAFYYCFVSLTTIGFGDLVPDRHEYIALMLIYLGVGLAVTTMCIDLVGIQYIQKIHYFGRKFKGTDILQILRRKRMLERRFAMGEGKELIEYVIKQEREALFPSHQPRGLAQPAFHLANQAHARDQTENEKISLRSEQQEMVPTEEAQVQEILPIHDLALACAIDIPRILEPATPIERRKLSTPTIETPSSESERLIMYAQQRHGVRADSWAESGPTPSVPSSTPSTAPSVRQRELIYEQFRSPQPSLTSFAFTFPPPSPDLRQIAEAARLDRRLASCPLLPFASVFPFPPAVPLVRAVELPPLSLPRPPPSPSPPPPEPTPVPELPVPKMAEQLELVVEDPHHTQPTLPPISRAAVMFEQIDELATDASVQSKVAQRLAPHQIASELLAISGSELRHLSPEQFVMEQQHLLLSDAFQGSVSESAAAESAAGSIEEAQKLYNLAAIEQQPNIVGTAHHTLMDSPMVSELEKMSEQYDLEEYGAMEEVGEEEEESEQSMFDIDLGAFELVDSAITAEELLTNEDPVIYHKDLPVHSVHHDTVQTEAAIENLMNASPSMLSTQVPPTMVADNYCFAVDGDRIQMADILGDEQWWKHTSRPTKYFYSKDLRRFYRVQCLAVRGRVVSARLANTTPAMGGGADDALAAELQQAISAAGDSFSVPSSLAFRRSVTFAGGGRASLAFVPPTSSDSATSAPLSSASHFQQQQQMLRRFGPDAQRGETVDLGDVYRVVRFYSFWRTCTSFHRIVTMIERIGQGSGAVVAAPTDQRRSPSRARNSGAGIAEQWCPPSQQQLHPRASTSSAATGGSEPTSSVAHGDAFGGRSPRGLPDFQKRLFVQYLWRNAKPSDKARVQREFDPRRQRLLKYVTDTAARKRMTSAKVQWRSGSAGTSTDKATKWQSLQTPPGSATAPTFSPSAPSVRWRLPPGASASAGAPSPNRSPTHSASPFAAARRLPHSAVSASLRRTRTSADMRLKK